MVCYVFFFKQKTAYEMRISDWSSDVCSSDLQDRGGTAAHCRHLSAREQCISDPCQCSARGCNDRQAHAQCQPGPQRRSEERREGKSVSVRVDLGGRRIIKKKSDLFITCLYLY